MSGSTAEASSRVLVAGVYLADRENRVAHIAAEMARSARWKVEQRWVALGESPPPPGLEALTVLRISTPTPKFALLNRILEAASLAPYDYLLVCDDDVTLPDGFLDRYLEFLGEHDLALAQPARTHESFTDHPIVEQLDGLDARRTRFVEIGPVFSIRRDAMALVLPFDEASPMGWGYDFVWPVVLEEVGKHIGIVDATPVAHDLRKPVALYDHGSANAAMKAYLASRPHLSKGEAFTILEAYAR